MTMGIGIGLGLPFTAGEGVGAWWPEGALWSVDYANGRFRDSDGVLYASEAAFNTAMGVSKSGEARTFAPVITGDEEFPDPGCTSATGWVGQNTTPSIVSNVLRATSTINGAGAKSVYKDITLTQDQGYISTVDMTGRGGTAAASNSTRLQMRTTGDVLLADDVSATTLNTRTIGFAPNGPSRIAVRNDNNSADTSTYQEMDNFSVKQAEPYKGHTRGSKSLRIAATTPSGSIGATQVLAMWGVSGATFNTQTCIRLERRTDTSVHLVATRFNVAQADLNLGNVAADTGFEVKLAVTANRISASLDGAPIVTDTSITVPGAAFFWLGRSFTGEAWGGTIQSVDVWAEALSDAALVDPFRAMVIWGDSLATTTGASTAAAAWWNQLAARYGWTVISKGNGGDTAAAVEARFDADPDAAILRSWLNIFINRPNGGETFEQFMAPHERMAGKVSRAFFVPPVLNSASGQPDPNAAVITAVQAELLTSDWAGRSLDASAQAALQTAMNDDSTRVGGSDWTHFDDSGHDVVDTAVDDGLVVVGLAA